MEHGNALTYPRQPQPRKDSCEHFSWKHFCAFIGLSPPPFLSLLLLISVNQEQVSQQLDILVTWSKSDHIWLSAGLFVGAGACGKCRVGSEKERRAGKYSLPIRSLCYQSQKTSQLFANQRIISLREPCSKCFQKHLWKVHRHFQATREPFLKLFSLCVTQNPRRSDS